MDKQQQFAERLRGLRRSRGMTQKEFAEQIGVTAASLSAYETGTKSPSLNVAMAIAQKLKVSLDWLCVMDLDDSTCRTYADVIQHILAIERANPKGMYVEHQAILFNDPVLNRFLGEFMKMKDLHDDNTIDTDVYSLWVEKTLHTYDYPIKEPVTDDDLPF